MYRANLDDQLDAGDYFALLKIKRAKVNEEMVQESDIFRGLVFYVNGQTDPPQNVLHEMVGKNGGTYQYHHDGKVTHVIAEQLSATKMRELGPTHHVVKAQWVVDCLKKKTRLSTAEYEMDRGEQKLFLPKSALAAAAPNAAPLEAETSVAKSSKDPNFLKDYFAQSRLHHLSSWRSEFQEELADEVLKLATEKDAANQQQQPVVREPIILHVDMDCFFASVAMRHNPSLQHVPVAVCHDSAHGEVSACNYLARDRGVKNGMFVKEAKALCPELQTVPYQFPLYEQTSRELFKVLLEYSRVLEIISCDEAYLDVSMCLKPDWNHIQSHQERSEAIAKVIREEVFLRTGCKASIGISYNMLLARMATRRAKPDGQFLISPDMVLAHLTDIPVSEIPGVGHQKLKKLKSLGIETCGQMQELDQSVLEQHFGEKTGEKLYKYCRGVCDRKIQTSKRRKNIGLDVNYGIRFDQAHEVVNFMDKMCVELIRRLDGRKGRRVTVKLMIKREDWTAPSKFLGHGRADSRQKSTLLDRSVGDLATIATTARKVYETFGIVDVSDIVGIGITLGKLDSLEPAPSSANSLFAPPVNPAPIQQKTAAKYATMTKDEIDPEVLKALGPQMSKAVLKEFEMASGPKAPVKHAAVAKQSKIVAKPKQQIFAPATPSAVAAPSAPKRNKYVQVDLNQVDESVLSELGEYGEILKAEMEAERKRRNIMQAPQTAAAKVVSPKPVNQHHQNHPPSPPVSVGRSVFDGRYSEWRTYFVDLMRGFDLSNSNLEACENKLFEQIKLCKCNLEDANLILSDLNRVVNEKGNDKLWTRLWNTLLARVQQEMIEQYGAVLNYDLK